MNSKILSKSFLWMFIGLLVTFVTGYVVYTNENILYAIFANGFYWFFIITELVLVIFLSTRIFKMQATTAKIVFLIYSFVSGLTFSSIFVLYQLSSILYVFLIAAALFGFFGFLGYTTGLDLTKFGTYLMMALFAVILCIIINMFLGSDTFNVILSIICILVFLGITAYDVQRLARINANTDNVAIYGALQLYLDFINIFLHLLSLTGKRK